MACAAAEVPLPLERAAKVEHLAAEVVPIAMRAFGVVQMAGAHERFERYLAVAASIFVDWH